MLLRRALVVELAALAGAGGRLGAGLLDGGGGDLSEGATSSASTSTMLRRSPSSVSQDRMRSRPTQTSPSSRASKVASSPTGCCSMAWLDTD
jgi:hypothetical protein